MSDRYPLIKKVQSLNDSWSDWDEAEQLECMENCQSTSSSSPNTQVSSSLSFALSSCNGCGKASVGQENIVSVEASGNGLGFKRSASFILQEVQNSPDRKAKRFRSNDSISCSGGKKSPLDPCKLRPKATMLSVHSKLVRYSSGVDGFPALRNYSNHVLLNVLSSEFDQVSGALKIIGQNQASDNMITVWAKDIWRDALFQVDSTLRLIEPLEISKNVYEVSIKNGLIIVEPETLISSTAITQALYCPRKAVLQDRFRGAGTSIAMLLGNVVHELFQSSIAKRSKKLSVQMLLDEYRKELMPEFCIDLIVLEMDPNKFEALLLPYLRNICSWIKDYFPSTGMAGRPMTKKAPTRFDHVADIEDNIWTPTLGFKGKIDVAFRSDTGAIKRDTLALELKTGRSYAESSIEHQTQVMIYSLMLSERSNFGRVLPGSVLYLKDNFTRQVSPKAIDLKGIVHMRNRLAPSFSRLGLESLPEPLRASRQCSMCANALICSLADKTTAAPDEQISQRLVDYELNSDMRGFFDKNLKHLSEEDIRYADRWFQCIFAEWKASKAKSTDSRLFQEPALQRQLHGSCLADMHFKSSSVLEGRRLSFLITFARQDGSSLRLDSMEKMPFVIGDMLLVSTSSVYTIMMGSVYLIDDYSLVIKTDKLIPSRHSQDEIYHLDKHTSFSSFSLMLTNVLLLMEDSEQAAELRSLIIQKRLSNTKKICSDDQKKVSSIMKQLRPADAKVVKRGVALESYLLIRNQLKTDEMHVVVALIRCFVKLGKSVLLTAYSNLALNKIVNELIKHLRKDELLCIGGSSRSVTLNPSAAHISLSNKMDEFANLPQMEYFKRTRNLVMNTLVVASTCLAVSSHSLFLARRFDVCVVVDASSVLEPVIIRPILQADSFILVGDMDCRPAVQSEFSRIQGMNSSLMERLMDQKNMLIDI